MNEILSQANTPATISQERKIIDEMRKGSFEISHLGIMKLSSCGFVASSDFLTFDPLLRKETSAPWTDPTLHWLRAAFVPQTTIPLRDLDQAVALAAGATVILFSLYSAGTVHYKAGKVRKASPGHDQTLHKSDCDVCKIRVRRQALIYLALDDLCLV